LPLSAFMIFSTFILGMSCYADTKINGFSRSIFQLFLELEPLSS